jgi:hypothetical protein
MKRFIPFILCHLLCCHPVRGVEIDGYREFSAGVVHLSLTEGEVTQSMELKWGGEGGDAAAPGPVLRANSGAGAAAPVTVKLDAKAAESLFSQAARLVPRYGLPAASTSLPKSGDGFQIRLGDSDWPLWFNYPKSEPGRWNQALELWLAMERNAGPGLPSKLMRPEALAAGGPKEPRPGVGPVSDYTRVKFLLTRVVPSKPDYESISLSWERWDDGKITLSATLYPRTGDPAKAVPEAKIIPAMHKQLQTLFRKHRHAGPPSKAKQGGKEKSDRIEVSVMVGDHPGEARITCHERDASQWADAQAIWSLAREQFPAP